MKQILSIGLHPESLVLLKAGLEELQFVAAPTQDLKTLGNSLQQYEALLIGEEVENPIRFAQEAYSFDKNLSILLLNDSGSYDRVKQALQFSPFIGPTVHCVSNAIGPRMVPIVEDALQRTAQRRSFTKVKSASASTQMFAPNALEKVRADFTAKVLEEAPVGAVLVSASGIVFSINKYALELFHKSEKAVLGTLFYELFPEQTKFEIEHFLKEDSHANPKKIFEVKNPAGTLYLELSVAPINIAAYANYHLIIISNLTTEIRAQQNTQAHLEELELLNTNLERVNADLDTFVYTASHDLKSPILNIEGLIASLSEELGPARATVEMELAHISRSIQRFKQTLEELTEVSRIQKNAVEEVIAVNMAEVVSEVCHLLEREIKDTETVFELDLDVASTVCLSRRNMTSVMYNLISNAIRYRSPARQPHIRVRTRTLGNGLSIAVQDNGLGIPTEKQDRVFELFKRMHSHVKGSGVGLYIVKRIIDNNGGSIQIQSEEGVGTKFEVSLVKPGTRVKGGIEV